MLQSVAVLYHPHRERAVAEAGWLERELRERGIDVSLGSGWDGAAVAGEACSRDLAVALGGDGTIIHVARHLAPCGVPLLGVNLGRVGFLADVTPEALHDKVGALAAGEFWVEERTMLDVRRQGEGAGEQFLCLNEVAVARGLSPQAVHVASAMDGEPFTSYTADALLVATATGSTAYSLAAGGPILYPESTDFMLTPVAPHLHIGRSIVVPGSSEVTLSLASDRPAVMSVDGSDERVLAPHHVVSVRRSALVARFARMGSRTYFYEAIAARLR